MRSHAFARVFIAVLAFSVTASLGCTEPTNAPSPMPKGGSAMRLSFVSFSPTEGSSDGGTIVKISGYEFQASTTVTVDGNIVDATIVDARTISLVMPAHAVGKAEVAVIREPGQAAITTQQRFWYFGPPAILQLFPNIGSTSGGAPLVIAGDGLRYPGVTLSIDGVVTPFEVDDWDWNYLYLTVPAHAAGTVDVVITNPDGRSGKAVFTYASPDTFDSNGDWKGWASLPGQSSVPVVLTIRDNTVIGVSCGSAPSLTLDLPVANGEFSFADSGGESITGKILSPWYASGTINMGSCANRTWTAEKNGGVGAARVRRAGR